MTIPWSHTALSYRNITLFPRDCYTYIYIYMKRFPLVQELKQCHTLLSQGLLCVLQATFSKECHTLLKAILCIHVKTINMLQKHINQHAPKTYHIVNYMCYLKMMLYFSIWMLFLLSKGDCQTPLFKLIYFMKSSSTLFKECRTLEKVTCTLKFFILERRYPYLK